MTFDDPTQHPEQVRSQLEGLQRNQDKNSNDYALHKRLQACALLLGLAAVMPACSVAEPDVDVSLHRHELYAHMMNIRIQAVADQAVIRDVKVNRGNCPLVENSIAALNQAVTLSFGEQWRAYPKSCSIDKVKEVEVTTGNGTFTFNF